jgi:hypothetical protein
MIGIGRCGTESIERSLDVNTQPSELYITMAFFSADILDGAYETVKFFAASDQRLTSIRKRY